MLEENIQSVPHVEDPRSRRYDDTPDMGFSEGWHYLVARHGYFKTLMFYLVLFFFEIFWFMEDCFGQINDFCHNLLTKNKRKEALHKMYELPDVVRNEYGYEWDSEFQRAITKAIEEATVNEKRTELQQCQKVAKGMIKDSGRHTLDRPFYSINQAFRLTGCHLTITDSQGKTITQIV